MAARSLNPLGASLVPLSAPWCYFILFVLYLEQDIEREIYRTEKAQILSEKKSLEEQIARIEQKRTGWLEPRLGQPRGAAHRAERRGFVGGNAWAALCAANEKVGQFSESQILVPPRGIEPRFQAPEACALSVELWGRDR